MSGTIGFDIGGTHIKAVAFDAEGAMLTRVNRPTRDLLGPGIPSFALTIREMIAEFDLEPDHIGIAAPGLAAADRRSIAIVEGKMHGLRDFDWTAFLDHEELIPVTNDAHAALLGESWRGAAASCQDAILLTLGTGVGGAILSDGRLLKGSLGRAGHFGHVSVEENNERSLFNTPGSLELAIGNCTIFQRSRGRFSATRDLVTAYRAGDADAAEIWLRSLRVLARAIVSFINILDPQKVIIGGGIAQAGDALFGPLGSLIEEIEWRPDDKRVPIVPAQLADWAGAWGAAYDSMNLHESPAHL